MNNSYLKNNILTPIITLILGILLIVIDGESLLNILFIILGVLIILFNIQNFITSIKNLKYKTTTALTHFINDLLIIIAGTLLIIFQQNISSIIGIILLVFVLIDLYLNKNNLKEELIIKLPFIILSIVLIVFGFSIIDILLKIIGIIFIVISIIDFIYIFIGNKNDKFTN